MKYLSRPLKNILPLLVIGAPVALLPLGAVAQARQLIQLVEEPSHLLLHSSSQGYLGVDVGDLDQEKAQALKLKETRGAVITLIDHDAPAGQMGLRVNDVILALNGQNVEGAEQLRRMLHEIPAGRKVSILISRDGSLQTLSVELADRKAMEQQVWNRIGKNSQVSAGSPGMGILADGNGSLPSTGFHMPLFGSSLNVGAMVEPLTSQMADYLGVQSGLMVKQVARKSEASAAGLKAFDVILKVGAEPINTVSDWDRSLRANQGKPVQITILRDKKQQTVTMQVDSKHRGEWKPEECSEQCPLVAEIDPDFLRDFMAIQAATAEALRDQAKAFGDQFKASGEPALSPEQTEEIRRQAEEFAEKLKAGDLKLGQTQLDELKRQMDEFSKNFKPDPKQMEEFERQMEKMQQDLQLKLKNLPTPEL